MPNIDPQAAMKIQAEMLSGESVYRRECQIQQ
jgi:hypothetical protein